MNHVYANPRSYNEFSVKKVWQLTKEVPLLKVYFQNMKDKK